jgi:hypothetical protein
MPVNAMEETPRQVRIVFFIALRLLVSAQHQVCQTRAANSSWLQVITACPFESVLAFAHVIC